MLKIVFACALALSAAACASNDKGCVTNTAPDGTKTQVCR